ncbi:hypothetical protein [Runella limosa]|uniref:hypothetical protein n=1 Tax=Runella limosa TaxID=370978 RepID=UPI000416BE9B|nr:hypothetical protein [Runella limosa]
MKKLLIFGIIILSVTGCKKAEIAPAEQLTNSIWTGFFKYKPVRENDNRQFVLSQCFAVSFLPNGVFKFYEALGESGGTWVLGEDNVITITQTNKNILKFNYNPANQALTFKSLTGAPDEWTASNMEQSDVSKASKMENVKWSYSYAGSYIIIKKDNFNDSYFETVTGKQAIQRFQTVIMQSGRVFIYRNNDEMYNTTATGPTTGITYQLVKQ